jgi:hypothetical protein
MQAKGEDVPIARLYAGGVSRGEYPHAQQSLIFGFKKPWMGFQGRAEHPVDM